MLVMIIFFFQLQHRGREGEGWYFFSPPPQTQAIEHLALVHSISNQSFGDLVLAKTETSRERHAEKAGLVLRVLAAGTFFALDPWRKKEKARGQTRLLDFPSQQQGSMGEMRGTVWQLVFFHFF